jgi:disulfide oxidoreductase YuzD
MYNHKLIGFILDLSKENLSNIQKTICELSKNFEKDDIFYVSSSWDVISKNEVPSYVLNHRQSKDITEELNALKEISKKTDANFQQIYFFITDQEQSNSNLRKIEKIKKNAEVVFVQNESIKKFETIFKENIYDENNQ